MAEPKWLNDREIVAIHNEIIAETGGSTGILNQGLLESTLSKPKMLHYYRPNTSLLELAAAYGYGFAKNHCFVDGNKRIALICVYTFLQINGVELIATEVDAANFFMDLAASMETQAENLAKLTRWIADNSIAIDPNR